MGVYWLGEYHHIYGSRTREVGIKNTLIGQIADLNEVLTGDDDDRSSVSLRALESTLPRWSFLEEVSCYIEYKTGNYNQAMEIGARLLEDKDLSRPAALMVAASAISLECPHRALEVYEVVTESNNWMPEISRPVGLLAAKLESLIEPNPSVVPFGDAPNVRDEVFRGAGSPRETVRHMVTDLNRSSFESLRFAGSVYDAWHSNDRLPADLFRTSDPLVYASSAVKAEGIDLESLNDFLTWCNNDPSSPYALETAA
ncbi:MAG: hypothetical protein WCL38_06360, partial [Actinomycetota bacterium]